MKPDEIKEFLVAQIKFLLKQANSDDERTNLEWWIQQISNLEPRAPRAEAPPGDAEESSSDNGSDTPN